MKPFERIREYRKSVLKINQDEFAKRLCMSRANVANIEVGRIELTDRTIRQICSEFGLSEQWIRTGEGEMTEPTSSSLVDQVCQTYKLDSAGRTLLETLLELPDGYAHTLLDIAQRLAGGVEPATAYETTASDEDDIDAPYDDDDSDIIVRAAHRATRSIEELNRPDTIDDF